MWWTLDMLLERLIAYSCEGQPDWVLRPSRTQSDAGLKYPDVFLATYPILSNCSGVFERLRRLYEAAESSGVDVCRVRRHKYAIKTRLATGI